MFGNSYLNPITTTPVAFICRGFFMPTIMKEHPAYYAILPANVRYDKGLKPMEKIIYAEITALSNKDGFCSASNRYFAELYDASEETVSRWVSRLNDAGYVAVLITRNELKQVIGRQIFPEPLDKKVNTPIDKKVNTLLTKKSIGIDEKVKVNTTSNNTTSINNSLSIREPENFEDASEKRSSESIQNLADYFVANPARWEELCNEARVKISKPDFWDNVKKWVRWNADNYQVHQSPVKALTSGRNNFLSWLGNERTRQAADKAKRPAPEPQPIAAPNWYTPKNQAQ